MSGSAWNVPGGGGEMVGTADAFHCAWQSFSGSGIVSAEASAQANSSPCYTAVVVVIRYTACVTPSAVPA